MLREGGIIELAENDATQAWTHAARCTTMIAKTSFFSSICSKLGSGQGVRSSDDVSHAAISSRGRVHEEHHVR
jgi:ABC-type uncharacterized transport system substrate-binding protein